MAEEFGDVFPLVVASSITDKVKRRYIEDRMNSTSAVTIADPMMTIDEDKAKEHLKYLKVLKADLESRNLKVGGVVGAGSMGIIFELKDSHDEVIKNSVLRIDPRECIGKLDDEHRACEPLAVLPMLFQAEAGRPLGGHDEQPGDKEVGYRATIVPRLTDPMLDMNDIKKTLAVFNAEGNLKRLKDLNTEQFMKAKGVDIPLLGDLGSISERSETRNHVKAFADTTAGLEYGEIEARKATPEEMRTLKMQKEAFVLRAINELRADGVNLDPVPTQQKVDKLEQVMGAERAHGAAKG